MPGSVPDADDTPGVLLALAHLSAAIPAERFLSERFGVSKLLVREAVHRLAEAGLTPEQVSAALDPAGYLGAATAFVDAALAAHTQAAS